MAADIERLGMQDTCKACGGGYVITTLEQKYCSKPCKKAAYVERRHGVPTWKTLDAYWARGEERIHFCETCWDFH